VPRPPGAAGGPRREPRTPDRRSRGPGVPWRRHDPDCSSRPVEAWCVVASQEPVLHEQPGAGGLPAPYRHLCRHPQPAPRYGTARRSPVDLSRGAGRRPSFSGDRRPDLRKTGTHVSRPASGAVQGVGRRFPCPVLRPQVCPQAVPRNAHTTHRAVEEICGRRAGRDTHRRGDGHASRAVRAGRRRARTGQEPQDLAGPGLSDAAVTVGRSTRRPTGGDRSTVERRR
jgi:hypothetical protein